MTAAPPSGSAADGASLLAARAAALGRPLETERDGEAVDLLVLTVGGQHVAIRVEDLREVRPPGPLTRVPGTGAALVGVLGGHGEPLAVAGLGRLLGLTPAVGVHQQWVAVLEDPVAPLGLLADTADDVVTVAGSDLVAPAESGGLVAAVAPGGVFLLDTAALLRNARLFLHPPDPTEEPS